MLRIIFRLEGSGEFVPHLVEGGIAFSAEVLHDSASVDGLFGWVLGIELTASFLSWDKDLGLFAFCEGSLEEVGKVAFVALFYLNHYLILSLLFSLRPNNLRQLYLQFLENL